MALAEHGLFKGRTVTSHPVVKDRLGGYKYMEDVVVVDGSLITSYDLAFF